MGRLLTLVKALAFAAIVLLLGQIRIGSDTIAERFQGGLHEACAKGGEKLMQTKFMASFANTSVVNQWLRNVYPPKVVPPTEVEEAKPAEAPERSDKDPMSSSDREAILQLLE